MQKNSFIKLAKTTLLITSIFLIGITTLNTSINVSARQNEIKNQELFNNPQAILNVSFKDNVYLDNIVDNELNSDKNWQGLKFDSNTFGISSISGLSNIGGIDEMVSINGQFSTRTIKRSYKDKLQELLSKIDDIKNNNQGTSNEKINKELSKMNSSEVKKQRYFNWSQSKILNIFIVGNTDTLTTIKTILVKSGHTKTQELIISSDLQAKLEEAKKNIDKQLESNNLPNQSELKNIELNLEDQKKVLTIINSSTQELVNSELSKTEEGRKQLELNKSQQALINLGKVNLVDKDYQAIDKLLITDNKGNKVIDSNLLSNLEILNYTDQEKTIIRQQIESYNDMPSYIKNNIQSNIEQLESTNRIQESSLTKAEKFVGGLVNGIKSEAGGCTREYYWQRHWWGYRYDINHCLVQDLNTILNFGGGAMAISAMIWCAAVCGVLSVFLGLWSASIAWVNEKCGQKGVIINAAWSVIGSSIGRKC
jgi:hypothetical protein